MTARSARTALRVTAWSGLAVLSAATLYGVAEARSDPREAPVAVTAAQTPTPAPSPDGRAEERRGRRGVDHPGKAHKPGHGPGADRGLGHGPWRFLGGRALHGEVVVERDGGGTRTVVGQRGTITAVSGSTVTVRSTDGFTLAWTVDDETRIRKAGGAAEVGDLASGDDVAVIGDKTGAGALAKAIRVRGRD